MSKHLYDPVSQYTEYNALIDNIESKIRSISHNQKRHRSNSVNPRTSSLYDSIIDTREPSLKQSPKYQNRAPKSHKISNFGQIVDTLKPILLDSLRLHLDNYKGKLLMEIKNTIGNMIQTALDEVYKDIAEMNSKIFGQIERGKKINTDKLDLIEAKFEKTFGNYEQIYEQTAKLGSMLRNVDLTLVELEAAKKKKTRTKKIKKLKTVDNLNQSFKVFKNNIEKSLDTLEHKIDHGLISGGLRTKERCKSRRCKSKGKVRGRSGVGGCGVVKRKSVVFR